MKHPRSHDEIAESIIRREGLTFALAASSGKEGDLREARAYLKAAIIRALVAAPLAPPSTRRAP